MLKKALSRLGYDVRPAEELYLNSLRQFDYEKIFTQTIYFYERYRTIAGVAGDIVECGVGYSRTFQVLACLLKRENNPKRTLFGFDSFEGFPEPTGEDNSLRQPTKGEWKVLTPAQLRHILLLLRLGEPFVDSRVRIVKGFFDETLPHATLERIAFLHLDVDLYKSYKTCLEHLFPRVVTGGVVLFDEYDSPNWPGAKKAIDEYFKHIPHHFQKDASAGKYFLVKT